VNKLQLLPAVSWIRSLPLVRHVTILFEWNSVFKWFRQHLWTRNQFQRRNILLSKTYYSKLIKIIAYCRKACIPLLSWTSRCRHEIHPIFFRQLSNTELNMNLFGSWSGVTCGWTVMTSRLCSHLMLFVQQ
jgi:hypothetical protein